MYICQICNKNFKNLNALHGHLTNIHHFTRKEVINYDIKYLNLDIPKCPICGKDVKIHYERIGGRLFDITCGNENCKKELYKRKIQKYYQEHPEVREKHRNDRIEYL